MNTLKKYKIPKIVQETIGSQLEHLICQEDIPVSEQSPQSSSVSGLLSCFLDSPQSQFYSVASIDGSDDPQTDYGSVSEIIGHKVNGSVSETVGHRVNGSVSETVGHRVNGSVSESVGHKVRFSGVTVTSDLVETNDDILRSCITKTLPASKLNQSCGSKTRITRPLPNICVNSSRRTSLNKGDEGNMSGNESARASIRLFKNFEPEKLIDSLSDFTTDVASVIPANISMSNRNYSIKRLAHLEIFKSDNFSYHPDISLQINSAHTTPQDRGDCDDSIINNEISIPPALSELQPCTEEKDQHKALNRTKKHILNMHSFRDAETAISEDENKQCSSQTQRLSTRNVCYEDFLLNTARMKKSSSPLLADEAHNEAFENDSQSTTWASTNELSKPWPAVLASRNQSPSTSVATKAINKCLHTNRNSTASSSVNSCIASCLDSCVSCTKNTPRCNTSTINCCESRSNQVSYSEGHRCPLNDVLPMDNAVSTDYGSGDRELFIQNPDDVRIRQVTKGAPGVFMIILYALVAAVAGFCLSLLVTGGFHTSLQMGFNGVQDMLRLQFNVDVDNTKTQSEARASIDTILKEPQQNRENYFRDEHRPPDQDSNDKANLEKTTETDNVKHKLHARSQETTSESTRPPMSTNETPIKTNQAKTLHPDNVKSMNTRKSQVPLYQRTPGTTQDLRSSQTEKNTIESQFQSKPQKWAPDPEKITGKLRPAVYLHSASLGGRPLDPEAPMAPDYKDTASPIIPGYVFRLATLMDQGFSKVLKRINTPTYPGHCRPVLDMFNPRCL